MQNYLSFLGGFLTAENLLSRLNRLPAEVPAGTLYTLGGFNLFVAVNDNPLSECIVHYSGNQFVFIAGFFYSPIEKTKLNLDADEELTAKVLRMYRLLNGSYMIIAVDIAAFKIVFKSDALGFEKCFYTNPGEDIIISSSIWPLTTGQSIAGYKAAEHLAFGHCLGDETLFPAVKLFQPAYITTLSAGTQKKQFIHANCDAPENERNNENSAAAFFEIAASNWRHVKSVLNDPEPMITLTGGGETRVILNAFLNQGLKPAAFTGSQPAGDIQRSSNIAQILGLRHYIIDFDEHLKDYWRTIERVVLLSNGFTNGWWMSLIAKHAALYGWHLYYGFSGDFIAGNKILNLPPGDSRLLPLVMKYKSMYDFFDSSFFENITGVRGRSLFENYRDTFNGLPDNGEILFEHERNEFNFKRISSFADGARDGTMPVFFFHDKRVLDFYRHLDKEQLKNEKFHRFIAAVNNPQLSAVSTSGKTNSTQRFETTLLDLFGKNLLRKAYEIKKNMLMQKSAPSFDFRRHAMFDYEGPEPPNNLIDWDYVTKYFAIPRISINDLEVLKMRLWDIYITFGLSQNFSEREFDIKRIVVNTAKQRS